MHDLNARSHCRGVGSFDIVDEDREVRVDRRRCVSGHQSDLVAGVVVPPEWAGRAMAVVISGFAVSGAVGMPLGRLHGEAVGWRASFLAVVLASTLALVVAFLVVPRVPAASEVGMLGQLRLAFAPRVLAVLAVGVLLFAGVSAALTYLVPFLGGMAKVSAPWIGVCLMGYGIAAAVGSLAGGRFADVGPRREPMEHPCRSGGGRRLGVRPRPAPAHHPASHRKTPCRPARGRLGGDRPDRA